MTAVTGFSTLDSDINFPFKNKARKDLIRDLYPEYLKDSYNSTIKRQITQLQMGKGFE